MTNLLNIFKFMVDNDISLSVDYIGRFNPPWDKKNAHCTYKCRIKTPLGKMSFSYYESAYETEVKRKNRTEETPPDWNDILYCVWLESHEPESSLESLEEMYNYTAGKEIRKMYDDRWKAFRDITKCFTKEQLFNLGELLNEE